MQIILSKFSWNLFQFSSLTFIQKIESFKFQIYSIQAIYPILLKICH